MKFQTLMCLVALTLVSCPPRAVVEHGVSLRWKKSTPLEVRGVVERRLALSKAKARVLEDDQFITVRVPGDSSAKLVKAVVSRPGTTELCEELPPDAGVGREAFGTETVRIPTECLQPRVMTGELRANGFAQMTWDEASAKKVTELTQRLLNQRLIFVRHRRASRVGRFGRGACHWNAKHGARGRRGSVVGGGGRTTEGARIRRRAAVPVSGG